MSLYSMESEISGIRAKAADLADDYARTQAEIEEAAATIRARGQQADALAVDVTDIDAVRTALAARAPYQGSEGLVELEQGRAVSQLARPLAALGHRIRIAPLQSGTAFVVRRHGHWEGASDPRRDGTFASSP